MLEPVITHSRTLKNDFQHYPEPFSENLLGNHEVSANHFLEDLNSVLMRFQHIKKCQSQIFFRTPNYPRTIFDKCWNLFQHTSGHSKTIFSTIPSHFLKIWQPTTPVLTAKVSERTCTVLQIATLRKCFCWNVQQISSSVHNPAVDRMYVTQERKVFNDKIERGLSRGSYIINCQFLQHTRG